VIRQIVGYHQDEAGDWVAELSCLHNQHVRHRPPFLERSWILHEAGRADRLGSDIECPLCDRAELPDGLSLLRTAGPWDESAVPAGLRRSHRTSEGTWGMVRVLRGRTVLHLDLDPPLDAVLEAGGARAIPPGVTHDVEAAEPFEMVLEFWGRP
jgi:tellurite resistance-related uncharacterized protein